MVAMVQQQQQQQQPPIKFKHRNSTMCNSTVFISKVCVLMIMSGHSSIDLQEILPGLMIACEA
eukprot:5065799-Amphidinium_carterae.1